MLCPGCNQQMKRLDRTVSLDPEFTIETWSVCYDCQIGAKVRAEFFHFVPDEE